MSSKELVVERLIVKGANGKGRLELDGDRITLYDDRNIPRARLALENNGNPRFQLYDALGHVRLGMNVNPKGETNLELCDGRERAVIWISTEHDTYITLYDETDHARLQFGIDENTGAPSLTLTDEQGTDRLELGVDHRGPAICTRDEQGKSVQVMTDHSWMERKGGSIRAEVKSAGEEE